MKRLIILVGLIVGIFQRSNATTVWTTDLNSALAIAKTQHKAVMLDFTGSDWCGWCMKLKKEVFDTPAFGAYAKANLILVEVDFPRNKEISEEQLSANQRLSRKYDVEGYPTIIFLDEEGNLIGRNGYAAGGPFPYIAQIERIPGIVHHDYTLPTVKAEEKQQAEAPKPQPTFVPIAPEVPNKYGELALKAISGTRDRRMAMINNQTFMTGETAKVKVHDQKVEVTVKEIRDSSVSIVVGGLSKELVLVER